MIASFFTRCPLLKWIGGNNTAVHRQPRLKSKRSENLLYNDRAMILLIEQDIRLTVYLRGCDPISSMERKNLRLTYCILLFLGYRQVQITNDLATKYLTLVYEAIEHHQSKNADWLGKASEYIFTKLYQWVIDEEQMSFKLNRTK